MTLKMLILAGFFAVCPAQNDSLSRYTKRQEQEFQKYQDDLKAGLKKQEKAVSNYQAQTAADFIAWQKVQTAEFKKFQDSIALEWGAFTAPGPKLWVEYGKDRRSFSSVDFEKGLVTVEALMQRGETVKQARKRLKQAMERTLTSRGGTLPIPVSTIQQLLNKPILDLQVIDTSVMELAEKAVTSKPDTAGRSIISVTFPLAPDHLKKRMSPYLEIIQEQSSAYGLNTAEVMAIIHTESAYNPMAVSSCGALGLMQLVPESGGREAYQYVYGADLIPSRELLMNPEKNIQLGCAYLYLLKNRYFNGVLDNSAKSYCAISAYNGGPKAVALAFTGEKKLEPAIYIINTVKNPEQVYNNLVMNLPFAETRIYLKS